MTFDPMTSILAASEGSRLLTLLIAALITSNGLILRRFAIASLANVTTVLQLMEMDWEALSCRNWATSRAYPSLSSGSFSP